MKKHKGHLLSAKYRSTDLSPQPYYATTVAAAAVITTETGHVINRPDEIKIYNYNSGSGEEAPQNKSKLNFYYELCRLNALHYTHMYNFRFENKVDYTDCLRFAKIFNIIIYDEKFTLSIINDYCLK